MSDENGNFASDSEGLKEAVQELQLLGGGTPPALVDPIHVVDESILPQEYDEFGQEKGINLRKAAHELRTYRERRTAMLEAFDQGVALDPEAQALQLQAQDDHLNTLLESCDAEQLRTIVAGHPNESIRVAASRVLERRLANYDVHLRNVSDYLASIGVNSMLERTQNQGNQLVLAQAMALQGLMAKHGFTNFAELEAIKAQDPQRHALIVGEAAWIDLHLAQAWQSLQVQAAQQMQTAAQVAAVTFADQASREDAVFLAANPDVANNPAAHQQVATDVAHYLMGLGLTLQDIMALWNGSPLFRSARAQQVMLDATRYRKALGRIDEARAAPRALPPVQRPGSREAQMSYAEANVRDVDQTFRENPTVRNAARLLGARKRARA